MTDLPDRLRKMADNTSWGPRDRRAALTREAADRIEELEGAIRAHRDELDAAALHGAKRDRDDVDNALYRTLEEESAEERSNRFLREHEKRMERVDESLRTVKGEEPDV